MTSLTTIRKQLERAAAREPESLRPLLRNIDANLKNLSRAQGPDRDALKTQIIRNVEAVERARSSSPNTHKTAHCTDSSAV